MKTHHFRFSENSMKAEESIRRKSARGSFFFFLHSFRNFFIFLEGMEILKAFF